MNNELNAKMDSMANSKSRQTLLNAYETLQEKNNQLKELKNLSIKLNEKFERTEGILEDVAMLKDKPDVKRLNLIELFMNLSDDMQKSINEIGNNTERVLNMID